MVSAAVNCGIRGEVEPLANFGGLIMDLYMVGWHCSSDRSAYVYDKISPSNSIQLRSLDLNHCLAPFWNQVPRMCVAEK